MPALRHVNIVGDTANPEEPGHDLTYLARAGLLDRSMPLTLYADMAGAERTRAAINEVMHEPGGVRIVGLYDVLHDLAAPLRHGLTATGGALGGSNPAYAVYDTKDGTIAVAALEPHFRSALYEGLGLPDGADLRASFLDRTAKEWEQWAKERDVPLARCQTPS
jgi:crotonobetainyl-CoA:carnitine CoA-transferase CaiB-like acyl-CoA transferase